MGGKRYDGLVQRPPLPLQTVASTKPDTEKTHHEPLRAGEREGTVRSATLQHGLLGGTIVNRTCGIHKNPCISTFLLTLFGPINYGPRTFLPTLFGPITYGPP